MTPKQKAFIRAYLVDPNATKAALEAGYSPKTAASQGQRLLKNVEIQTVIDKALAKLAEGQEVRAAEVIRETKAIAMSNMADFISVDDEGTPFLDVAKVNRTLGGAVKSLEVVDTGSGPQRKRRVKIVLHDKLRALDKLDAAMRAFAVHNPGLQLQVQPVIHVISPIPGPPGSRIGMREPE